MPGARAVLEAVAALGLPMRVASNSSHEEMAAKFAGPAWRTWCAAGCTARATWPAASRRRTCSWPPPPPRACRPPPAWWSRTACPARPPRVPPAWPAWRWPRMAPAPRCWRRCGADPRTGELPAIAATAMRRAGMTMPRSAPAILDQVVPRHRGDRLDGRAVLPAAAVRLPLRGRARVGESERFKVMERRLLKQIMTPAMIATWVFGILLVLTPGAVDWSPRWWHVKLPGCS